MLLNISFVWLILYGHLQKYIILIEHINKKTSLNPSTLKTLEMIMCVSIDTNMGSK